jgi:hypothetical protein
VKELVDPIHDIEERYPEYFPMKKKVRKENTEKAISEVFEADIISKRSHKAEKVTKKMIIGATKQKDTHRKWTPKRDRRHPVYSGGVKERRTQVNRDQRRKVKKDLKDLLAV